MESLPLDLIDDIDHRRATSRSMPGHFQHHLGQTFVLDLDL